jgi:thymidylate synthase (FAD)
MIEGYDIEVRLLAVTGLVGHFNSSADGLKSADSEVLIEYAGRLCWDTTNKLGSSPDRIRKWIDSGHESLIEHASASFFIRASRVLTHELVRHRLASYSQRSQRYVRENQARYISPPEISADNQSNAVFQKAMQVAWNAYDSLLKIGVIPELARYVLPNACETQIVMTMNFRELRHFIKLRTSKRALPEMRAVAGEVRRIMKKQAPQVFSDL